MSTETETNIVMYIDIRCDECGNELDAHQEDKDWNSTDNFKLRVSPCEVCAEKVREEAHEEGRQEREGEGES